MEDAFRRILSRLPFPVREVPPDNGSEFFNHHLVRFWKDAVTGVQLSRSRPWYKNNTRFVEHVSCRRRGKSWTLVHAYLGNVRLDTVDQTNVPSQLYDEIWPYYNLFQPLKRMTEKTILSAQQGEDRVRRSYDTRWTPFQRLRATNAICDEQRRQLQSLRDDTNARHLRRQIYALLDKLFSLQGVTPGITEDAFLTPWLCH